MAEPDLTQDDTLEDFDAREMTFNGVTKRVHVSGSGPAVIVMTEIPGITPHVARFARWVRDAGFTVYMPSLFGVDGKVASAEYGEQSFQAACVSAEFRSLARQGSSPVTKWLMALARDAHGEAGGPGVGAIGMCFTGNFALSMMMEPAMLAPVLSQPALPLDDAAEVESPPEELAAVRERLEKENLTVRAYRFEGDKMCTGERWARYAEALGERFEGRVLPDSAANTDTSPFYKKNVPFPHSVVTQGLINEAGQPTKEAKDDIIAFFGERLKG